MTNPLATTPRDICKCGQVATITIAGVRLCRFCSERVCLEACRRMGRMRAWREIGCVLR